MRSNALSQFHVRAIPIPAPEWLRAPVLIQGARHPTAVFVGVEPHQGAAEVFRPAFPQVAWGAEVPTRAAEAVPTAESEKGIQWTVNREPRRRVLLVVSVLHPVYRIPSSFNESVLSLNKQ